MEDKEAKNYYSLKSLVVTIRAFLKHLRRKWWVVAIGVLAGVGIGFGVQLMQKAKYEAVTTFILEEKSAGGGGGLAGIASQFGVNLGGLSGGGSLFSGDNILNILTSKSIVQKVLLSKIDNNSSTLIDHYLEFSGLRSNWAKKPELNGINFKDTLKPLSPLQDSVMNVVYQRIVRKELLVEKTSKQGSIIKVKVTSQNSQFSRVLSQRLVDEASRMYIDIKVGTAEANIRQLQQRADSLLWQLNRKSFTAAASQPIDINPAIRTAVVPGEIASRDKTVLGTLYIEVTKNLEASKMLLSQQTPVIQLLDTPSILLDDERKGKLFMMVIGGFILAVLTVAGMFGLFILKNKF